MRAMFIKALMLVRSVGRVVRLSCISESEISRVARYRASIELHLSLCSTSRKHPH